MKLKDNKLIKIITYCFFPIFIVLITEFNHMQSFNKLLGFVTSKFPAFLYSVLLISVLFFAILFFTKKSHIAVGILSITLYILSTVEYFKYTTSGTHLTLSDLVMTRNIGDVGKFAKLNFTWPLIICLILIIGYIVLCKKYTFNLPFTFKRRFLTSFICICTLLLGILLPKPSTNIYATFNLDNETSTNIFAINESFESNGLIGFLSQTTSNKFTSRLRKPENYSEDLVNNSLSEINETSDDYKKPNVIFIMSESFGDFRSLESSLDLSSYYESFDEISKDNFIGNCVVPTFGGYTPRTEFELLFGLPVYSLNTPSIPHNLLTDDNLTNSIPSYFKDLGYNTTYIHPFSGSFYSRNSIYGGYGFNNLFFEEDMINDSTRFRRYIDDYSVFEKIKQQLEQDDSPSYIFTTTMQNHQPYYDDDNITDGTSDLNELKYYLEGIKKTSDDLKSFLEWLNNFEEDVILVFVGDHYPFFTPTSDIYSQFGIDSSNTENLYNQKYLIYNNYDKDFSYLNDTKISTFYLPYVVIESLGTPLDKFSSTMINHMETTPIYSPNIQSISDRDAILDVLTYDRVEGESYSNK
ncbi:sulfatase-like hydrolase/transferase [Clostridium sp. NSJ-49]|uniref:LTA synthase family protein n=2 Tax=Clostridium TaxID=1485 RepID=UPI00164A294D|nr:LTA synthase family protein [Clostridium sp. NSJ-49]MBC5624862.1 sulfatase-like hydrolase/transferase [Clostridium sp. NSJ-49]